MIDKNRHIKVLIDYINSTGTDIECKVDEDFHGKFYLQDGKLNLLYGNSDQIQTVLEEAMLGLVEIVSDDSFIWCYSVLQDIKSERFIQRVLVPTHIKITPIPDGNKIVELFRKADRAAKKIN